MKKYCDKYGNLSALDAAMLYLKEIEEALTPAQLAYIREEDTKWDYDNHRLYCQIMGLQMVIIRNGGHVGFSGLPLLWKPHQ